MAKVSLRIYNREIESLIDQGHLDEAIAHCHHILKTFPKHLETYRLLGKSFLEAKRHNEAVDIFSRLLLSVPDDFVSHVGMSIINDDQNKLDNAIWHMERAFESQPSNAAIQGELQRLYGRRDGIEPPKIRMTRGALAYMYVQGELYPQAISEIRSVLQQDPQRADMQVLLARAYYKDGQKADASDICSQLIKRYPYCFDANRILVDLLPASDRAENTQVYRLRIYELDPYATFAQGSVFNSNEVADAAVSLERLDYSGQDVGMEQDWGTSLGIGLTATPSTAPEPDWLRSGGSASSEDAQPAAVSQPKEDIPDFLRAAGWGESSGESEEAASAFESNEVDELTPAELPDWMKAMAPAQQQPAPSAPPPAPNPTPSSDDSASWLKNLGAIGAASEASQPEEESPFTSASQTAGSDVPEWLKGMDGEEPSISTAVPAQSQDDMPDWLGGLGSESPASQPSSSMDETSSWLKNLSGEEPAEAQPASDMPDWLSGLGGQESAQAEPSSDMPDWLSPKPTAPSKAPADSLETLGTSAEEQDDAVSWLESLATKHGAKPEELVTDPSTRTEKPPEWVEQARDIAQSQPPVEKPAASLESLGASAQEQDDAVSWLESLASKHGAKPEELVTDPNTRTEKPPEWVEQARDIAQSQPPVEKPAASLESLGASAQEQEDAVSWLESLASKHGAKPEELVTDPNTRSDTPPEWVEQARDMAQSQPPAQDETGMWLRDHAEENKPAATEDKETSDWLAGLASSVSGEPSEWQQPAKSESGLPDWSAPQSDESKPMWDEPAQPQEPTLKETPLPESSASVDLPDWLRGFDEAPQGSATEASVPSWLNAEEEAEEAKPERVSPAEWRPVEPPASEPPTRKVDKLQMEEKPTPPAIQPQPTTQAAQPDAPLPVPPKAKSMPKPARQAVPTSKVTQSALDQAQEELNRGDIPSALDHYNKFIKKGKFLDETIQDLREALYRYPVEVNVWQTLGDAYMRSNRLQEALDAYTKAEELLR